VESSALPPIMTMLWKKIRIFVCSDDCKRL